MLLPRFGLTGFSVQLVDFPLLEAYGLFFHYVYGKTNHKLPDDKLKIYRYPPGALKSGSGQDEKLIINFMWPQSKGKAAS